MTADDRDRGSGLGPVWVVNPLGDVARGVADTKRAVAARARAAEAATIDRRQTGGDRAGFDDRGAPIRPLEPIHIARPRLSVQPVRIRPGVLPFAGKRPLIGMTQGLALHFTRALSLPKVDQHGRADAIDVGILVAVDTKVELTRPAFTDHGVGKTTASRGPSLGRAALEHAEAHFAPVGDERAVRPIHEDHALRTGRRWLRARISRLCRLGATSPCVRSRARHRGRQRADPPRSVASGLGCLCS